MSETSPKPFSALIIGGGPAGLSAALSLARVNHTSALFDSGEYRNQGAEAMHSFVSRDGIDPEEFRAVSRKQIEDKYSNQVVFFTTKIVSVVHRGRDGFEVVDSANNIYTGRKLVLATGSEDIFPAIEGFKENWPGHIYQCPFCDGLERKDYPVGILPSPNPAWAQMAFTARAISDDFTLYSNGPVNPEDGPLKKVLATGLKLDERRIRRLINNGHGPENGISIEFEDGSQVKLGMLYYRPPTRSRAVNLIEQLSLKTKPNRDVETEPMMMQSSLAGCFVIGDAQEMMKNACIAAASGVRAAAGVAAQIATEKAS